MYLTYFCPLFFFWNMVMSIFRLLYLGTKSILMFGKLLLFVFLFKYIYLIPSYCDFYFRIRYILFSTSSIWIQLESRFVNTISMSLCGVQRPVAYEPIISVFKCISWPIFLKYSQIVSRSFQESSCLFQQLLEKCKIYYVKTSTLKGSSSVSEDETVNEIF